MSSLITGEQAGMSRTKTEDVLSLMENRFSELIRTFAGGEAYGEIQLKTEENEKEGFSSFHGLSDLELIYYFVHIPTDTDEEKNRNRDTKKDYLRELLLFYKRMLEHTDEIRGERKEETEPSLFKGLRKLHIRRYQEWLKTAPLGRNGNPYSPATLSWKTIVLKSFLTWLYRIGHLQEDVTLDLISTNLREWDKPNRDMSYEQVAEILDFYKAHTINYALLSVLATTGARVAEIANSKFSDLYYDPYNGHYWLKVTGKGKKNRELLIFHNVLERILAFRKRRGLNTVVSKDDHSPLFVTNKGKAYSPKYLSSYITDIIEKTNLPFVQRQPGNIGPHHFRHYFAIYSAQKGADIFRIQQTLGHESIETTKIYLERFLEKKHNVALLWDESKF